MKRLKSYGEWAFVLVATDGIGKCFCQYFTRHGLNVILVGRRKEKIDDLAAALLAEYQIDTKVVPQDLTEENACENLIAAVKGLDIGAFNYVQLITRWENTGRFLMRKFKK